MTREEKSTGFLKQLNKTDNSMLRNFRYLHCIVFIANELSSLLFERIRLEPRALYKTNWGWWLYGTYVITIAYAHYRHETRGKALGADTSSPFHLWKVCTVLYEILITDHLIITIFYWTLTHSTLDPPFTYWRIMRHSLPLPLMLIDFAMSNMLVEMRHIAATVFYGTCYASLLVTYTLTQKPDTIYSWAHLTTAASWAMLGAIIAVMVFSHLILATLSRYRHKNKLATSSNDLAIEADKDSLILIVLP